jgi:chromosome segregation ATPase
MARTMKYGEKVPLEDQIKALDARVEAYRNDIKTNEIVGFERETNYTLAKKRKASKDELDAIEQSCVEVDKLIETQEQSIKDLLAEKTRLTSNRQGRRANAKVTNIKDAKKSTGISPVPRRPRAKKVPAKKVPAKRTPAKRR